MLLGRKGIFWTNWGLTRCFASDGRREVVGPEGYMAVDERYMRLPSSLRGPFALISTRSGTRLEKTALHTFSLGSKRPRQVFNASPSAGGLKCPLEKLVSHI